MRTIKLIVDYKNRFGTKYTATPYRSGMDKNKLRSYFNNLGYSIQFVYPWQINFENCNNELYLYTSSEDRGLYYKSYIEDVVLGLKLAGAHIIPDFKFLRAHHNKVFMEILRKISNNSKIDSIHSKLYGTLEELREDLVHYNNINHVLKPSEGAMSKGVSHATNLKQLLKQAKIISNSSSYKNDIIDILRSKKHKEYIKESRNRKKFIVQNFIPNLEGDWKVLIFWDKFYVLRRLNRKNDFRASGGGRLSYTREVPTKLLSFARDIANELNLPNVSFDIAYDGDKCYLLEFQALYFGTYTLEHSQFYFIFNNKWEMIEESSILEKEYAKSIVNYIENNFNYLK